MKKKAQTPIPKLKKATGRIVALIVLLTTILSLYSTQSLMHGQTVNTYNSDGAWCWFGDPRAVHYQGNQDKTYIGWITSYGSIVVSSYNHSNGVTTNNVLRAQFQQDDHANPSIFIRNDGRIMVFYGAHFGAQMYVRTSTNPEDISSFGGEVSFGSNVTYPNPFQVGNSIYCFFRGGSDWHPYVSVSNDGGQTWGQQRLVIQGGGQRPYAKFAQDNTGGIHMAFTHGHPRQEGNNQIYYVYLRDGNFYRANGSQIKSFSNFSNPINIDAGEPEVVYNASNGKGWIWDIAADGNNRPVLVYAAFPSDNNHQYYYARWNGSSWQNNHVSSGGSWFPQTPGGSSEPEPNYSGGITLDHSNTNRVYLSKPANGVFEIFQYTTSNGGSSWSSSQVTTNTPSGQLNVRPFIPRNRVSGDMDLLWMRGTYTTYTNYNTAIMFRGGSSGGSVCDPSSITPYSQVNGGSWSTNTSITINQGDEIRFGPQPTSGSWSWSGCGTSGSSREQTISPSSNCSATATYTNSCGAQSSVTYNITVSGSGGGSGSGSFDGSVVQLRNRGTGLVADGYGNTGNGDACNQYDGSTTHPNSHWEMIDAGSSQGTFYYLQNVGTEMKLDGYGRTENGSDVAQYANSTTHVNAQWTVEQYDGSYYRIQNRGTGLFLDGMGRTANGDALGQYANTSDVNAQWELVSLNSARAEQNSMAERNSVITVYPNPATESIRISTSTGIEGGKIAIYNNVGQLVMSRENIKANTQTFDLSNFSKGIYIVKVSNNHGTDVITKMFSKE